MITTMASSHCHAKQQFAVDKMIDGVENASPTSKEKLLRTLAEDGNIKHLETAAVSSSVSIRRGVALLMKHLSVNVGASITPIWNVISILILNTDVATLIDTISALKNLVQQSDPILKNLLCDTNILVQISQFLSHEDKNICKDTLRLVEKMARFKLYVENDTNYPLSTHVSELMENKDTDIKNLAADAYRRMNSVYTT